MTRSSRTIVVLGATSVAMLGTYYTYDSIGPVADLLSRELGLSDFQIGALNAVYSLPNIFMVAISGVLVDRCRARLVALCAGMLCFLGAILTAVSGHFLVMICGRLLFGMGAESLFVAIFVAIAEWFEGRHFALVFAGTLSIGRVGSYLADRSPSFARSLYERSWQPPLALAATFSAVAFVGVVVYWMVDRRRECQAARRATGGREQIIWKDLVKFGPTYWYIVGLCVSFYSVIFPFRSTFAIKYLQHAHGLRLEDASRMNSYVFVAAIVATPLFGLLVDRIGRRAQLLVVGAAALPLSFMLLGTENTDLWLPTALLGLSFSLVPAVLWPAVALYVGREQRGTAYGLMTMLQSVGLTGANLFVGYLNDRNFAGALHPEGYMTMLWFFGSVSLAGFLLSVLLYRHDAHLLRQCAR